MSNTSTKKLALAKAQAPRLLANLAEAHTSAAAFTTAQLNKLSLTLERDAKIDEIKKQYSPTIEQLDGTIDRAAKELK